VGRPESGPVTLAVHPIRETIMTALTGTGPPASAGEDLTLSDGPDSPGLDPQQAYALGADTDERTRLTRQSDELRPEAETLLARIGLRPGHAESSICWPPRCRQADGWWGWTPTPATSRRPRPATRDPGRATSG
jgi:hypothetical protein